LLHLRRTGALVAALGLLGCGSGSGASPDGTGVGGAPLGGSGGQQATQGGSYDGSGGGAAVPTGGSPPATGGSAPGSGGASVGGTTTTGGATTGGSSSSPTGGASQTGGTSPAGGTSAGGTPAGGRAPTGGNGSGGTAAGGTASGGTATGGTAAGGTGGTTSSALKPRVVALTDIGPDSTEPDDSESLIRLYVHADRFEIEGVIAGSGYNTGNYPASWADRIGSTIDAYEKDAPNLLKRSSQSGFQTDEERQPLGYWPSPDYLRSRKMLGSPRWGSSVLGDGNESDGSRFIVELGDEADERPIWVTVWGGANTFAQALWRVQHDRTAEEFKAFVRKFRIYTITDQDKAYDSKDYASSCHQWIRKQTGTDLLFLWDECAWLDHNGWGVDHWTDLYAPNIQGHGNLGAIYSKYKYGVEGDTPSFLHVMPNGLSDPDAPDQGSWGGYFAYGPTVDGQTSAWVNQEGAANTTCHKYTKSPFFPAAFNDFAARMDWAKDGTGNRNPVVVVNGSAGLDVLTLKPAAGESVTLDASKTTDPDGDGLTFRWWVYTEAGTYAQNVTVANGSTNEATIAVPTDAAGKSFHVICEVTDDGTPKLTSYRRIVFEPTG
jgi:hypothetical protein